MSFALKLPLLTIGALLTGVVVMNQVSLGRAVQEPSRPALDSRQAQELRTRWESLSEQERVELRDSLQKLKQLPADKRAEIREHARRLEHMGRLVYSSLSRSNRERLDSLPPTKREQLLREMALAEVQDMGRRLFAKLPADARARLAAAEPEERLLALLELREDMNRRISHSIKSMGAEMGLRPDELEALAGLSPEKRRERFLKIVKKRAIRAVDHQGLPDGADPERWRLIKDLPADEFYLSVLRLRRRFPELGAAVRAGRDLAPRARTSHDRLRATLELELDPAARLKLSKLSRAEREREIHARQRARAQEVLAQENLLDAEELERLGGVSDRAFFRRLREVLGQAARPAREDRPARGRETDRQPERKADRPDRARQGSGG